MPSEVPFPSAGRAFAHRSPRCWRPRRPPWPRTERSADADHRLRGPSGRLRAEAAGTAARWAQLGYKVKFVSVTNGDIGHHEMAGAILARRRTAEVKRCAEILGIESEVLDIHDGELLPTLENRRTHHPQDPRVAGRRRDRPPAQ